MLRLLSRCTPRGRHLDDIERMSHEPYPASSQHGICRGACCKRCSECQASAPPEAGLGTETVEIDTTMGRYLTW